jgi:hypothetical protein
MRGADGDRQRIAAGLLDEADGIVRLGVDDGLIAGLRLVCVAAGGGLGRGTLTVSVVGERVKA